MRLFGRLFLTLSLMIIWLLPVSAQPSIAPEMLTNRPLGYLNDATSVGWNPAVLGVHWDEFEIVAAGSYDRTIALRSTLFAAFAKLGPVAFGVTGAPDNSTVNFTRQYFAGFGLPAFTDELWLGGSVRWLDGGGFIKSGEIELAGLYRPISGLHTGITVGNLTANNGAGLWASAQASYAPTSWLTMLGGFRADQRDTLGGYSGTSPTLGMSLGIGDNSVTLSGIYDFNRKAARFGFEWMLGDIGVGTFNGIDGHGAYQGGVGLARWSTIDETPPGVLPGESDHNDMGWAPDRAYIPTGLEQTEVTSSRDAMRTQSAVDMPCVGGSSARFETPSGVAAIVREAGTTYAPLARSIVALAPDSKDLFRAIRKRYYSPPVRNRELASGDTLAVVSEQGHAISVQSVDAARFPLVSVIMRVVDENGRTVPGLDRGDFKFRDTSTRIVSVRPTDSSFSVPVDIVVLVDCSGSMSDEIEAVRQNVERFADNLESRGIDYRIGGVLYGSVIYDTLHPTDDLRRYKQFLASAAPIGGDEITTLAVKAATEMDFRPGAQRVFVMITDDWAVQNNSRLDEPQLTQMLWDTRARLYSIITPCKNNSAVMTRLTLGREFDIRSPFISILDEIGTDLTTTYELVYESQVQKEVVVPKVTMLRGRVRDETGAPVAATFPLEAGTAATLRITTNPTTGEYETEIAEGLRYVAHISANQYLPLEDAVDMRSTSKGDTVSHDFTLRIRPTTVSGRVTDERGSPITANVRIEDANSLEQFDTVETIDGQYEAPIGEGRVYRLTPSAKNYIPFPEEVDARVSKGTALNRDLKVMSIDAAIASGAVFRLKNIFFDFDRTDLKGESSNELDRLVALLNEYPIINVEIGAHTDSKGSDTYNTNLSARRAQSVRDYLISQGIAAVRLSSKGYGESVPVASNDTDEGRALNRRVEFKLVK